MDLGLAWTKRTVSTTSKEQNANGKELMTLSDQISILRKVVKK